VRRAPLLLGVLTVIVTALGFTPAPATAAPCDAPIQSQVACENTKPGNPASEWDVSGSGDPNIQGFTTDISADQGQTVQFKIDSVTSLYRLDIYRMGWYGGSGARKVATVRPLTGTPQQPACLTNAATGLVDCGNWSQSASWTVPADAVSGIYFAKLVREDAGGGSSHVMFVVRDDDGASELLFQTSDTTWQAYNRYGGNSLYTGGPGTGPGRAYKVSYNRPFTTRGYAPEDWVFNAEYPMVRWLERNGYDMSYSTGVDGQRRGAELLEHETVMSVGHDEYWSGGQRANFEAARAAGVNLAFFSGNEVFWKTRWEASIDSSATANRTLVSYKETHAGAKIDPQPGVWTGTWRDPRFSPPADGGRPENALTGQLFMVNDGATTSIRVPSDDGKMRLWRNTSVASLGAGQEAVLPDGTLGYEWDEDPDNGFRPAGSVRMSSTTVNPAPVLTDNGSNFGSGAANHHLTLYKASSGALVFGAGTVQWSWGLDNQHDRGSAAADSRMQQATANLFSDMGAQPSTLQAGLVAPVRSTDTTAPNSTITSPANGAALAGGQQVTITGTASDTGGGVVGAVEVSVDGGTTWRMANGRGNWTFNWTPSGSGTWNIRSRAVDDSANRETASAGISGTVGPRTCPCSIWDGSTVPANEVEPNDHAAVELGVKFRPNVDGRITGLRFYKGTTNTGTHVGHLWSRTGTMLAEATFTGETARGWQQVSLSSPVNVTAGTTYVASYHAPVGQYAWNRSYFESSGFESGPLRALAQGEDGGNGVYGYGPSRTFPSNTYLSENYWVDVVFENGGGAPDTTPPTVTGVSPAAGATDVSSGANVTATFSEPMNASTVTSSTVELRGPAGGLVSASVTYDPTTRTATLDPASALANSTEYTATVKSGAGGVKDQAGNALASDRTWSFTTAQAPPPGGGCPCSIWPSTTVPANEAQTADTSAVELGVKFRPQENGQITGLRFYKGTTNSGTHVGHLWSATGSMLAEATFSNETPRGWQEVTLSSPVSVTAGTTYVASYHAPNGNYAWNSGFFASAGVDNPPLRALANSDEGGNGVYAYGPSRSFPNNNWQSTNYWVDVVFQGSGGGGDTTPPTITTLAPQNGATGVSAGSNVTASFNEPMSAASVSGTTFELRGPGGALVNADVSYTAGSRTAVLDPANQLSDSTTYTATVKGGSSGVKDSAGNALAADRTWIFTTADPPPPPPDDGPGGPILGISKSSNPFSRYYAEILRNEGLNEFSTKDISTVTPAVLSGYDVVVLGEMSLTAAQVTMLTDWVNAGGNLIAMRPDKQLAGLLGLLDASATLQDAYLKVDTSKAPGAGIVDQTMQYHGGADRYVANGATTVATLFSGSGTATTNPAVTVRDVGSNGGQAAAFTFDLAKSVVYTRQGNPAWENQERDGIAPIRSDDLFFGGSQSNWVDLGKVAIPSADEQQRLLANLIGHVNQDKKPLPRFWYFPRGEKAVVVMTGDDHGNNGTAGRFNQYKQLSPAGCNVAQWECIRSSSYMFPSTPMSNTAAAGFEADGFELGVHLNTGCSDWSSRGELEDYYTTQLGEFRAEFPSLPPQTTHRTHCIAWGDWATQPKVEAANGIRLDTNYYYWPPAWVANVPGMFTGSGMPMRFADLDGSMIDVYQATTQMTDESDQDYPFTPNTLLDRALGPQGYYGAFTANLHTDQNTTPQSDATVQSAIDHGVPVVSGEQMLTWLDGRNSSSFGSINWNAGTLTFTVNAASGSTGLQGMLPLRSGNRTLNAITRGGSGVSFTTETIKGVEYALFSAAAGSYSANYAVNVPPPPDTTPPAISSVAATANTNGTATVTWSTNEASNTRVDFGTVPDNLSQNASDAANVTSHSIQLSGLTPGATYHYRVRSADAAGNAAQSPAPPAAPANFRVPQAVDVAPNATVIETGTAGGGTFASLSADDNVFYNVNSTLTGTRTSSWYGSFTGVANGLSNLRANYRGRNSVSCTQTVHIWRWTTSTWVQLDSRAVGTTEVALLNLTPTGAAADYVSGTTGDGEVRVRVRCTRATNFASNGDLLRISFVR
jgi:Domain of unknown function (DUF4082)/Bacterial Ig-like domain/Bacterial Ig domain/Purple acid Phosphatase, N-terminal domain